MITPSIKELTKDQINRYELVIAVAKGAKIVTDSYCQQREEAEKMIARKETDKPMSTFIDSEYRDTKAVKIAINRIKTGEFEIVKPEN